MVNGCRDTGDETARDIDIDESFIIDWDTDEADNDDNGGDNDVGHGGDTDGDNDGDVCVLSMVLLLYG